MVSLYIGQQFSFMILFQNTLLVNRKLFFIYLKSKIINIFEKFRQKTDVCIFRLVLRGKKKPDLNIFEIYFSKLRNEILDIHRVLSCNFSIHSLFRMPLWKRTFWNLEHFYGRSGSSEDPYTRVWIIWTTISSSTCWGLCASAVGKLSSQSISSI